MVDDIKNEATRVLAKIQALKHRLDEDTLGGVPAVDDVIKTVAISTEISKELKEVLIVLSSAMVTETVNTKNNSYKTNIELIRAAEDILTLQLSITNRLAAKNKPVSKTVNILKDYHRPIALVCSITALWALASINSEALKTVMSYIAAVIKGVL